MEQTFGLYESKLREAAEFLSTGQKKNARLLIREVLSEDKNNLAAWELLYRASYNNDERIVCLERLLKLQPHHPWARQELAFLKATSSGDKEFESDLTTYPQSTTFPRKRSTRRRDPLLIWAAIIFGFLGLLCLGAWALAVYRIGVMPVYARNETATAYAANQVSCQALIERAMQASGQYCNQIGANRVCYGNNTLKADLVPNSGLDFSKRGDTINVSQLQRLSASPLNTSNNEWGVAIFQVQAYLQRTVPGEMVKMVVFGNTSLKNTSGNLQSFYFSSGLGQLVCEKLPYDGIMVTMPNGTSTKFTVNGAEMVLSGNASLKAAPNEKMEVSLFSGFARITAAGQEQYLGPGQKVDVQLGGANGTEAVGPPSAPQPLSSAEFNVSCSLTGSFCSQSEIKPVTLDSIKTEILSALGITPTATMTLTYTPTLTETASSTVTLTNVPSLTPLPTSTDTPTATRFVLPSLTFTPKPQTPKPTRTPTKIVSTSTPGPSPTITNTPTNTLIPTNTLVPTQTDTPLPTSTPPTAPMCGNVSSGGLVNTGSELDMNISNNSGGDVTITNMHVTWVKDTSAQKFAIALLNSEIIWNTSDPSPASDIPEEGDWKASAVRTIPAGATWPLAAQFQNSLAPGDYSVAVVFDIGCQVQASITVP